jgi:hypothetical protein
MSRLIFKTDAVWGVLGGTSVCGFVSLGAALIIAHVNPRDYQLGGGYSQIIDSAAYVTLAERSAGVLGYVSPKVILPLLPTCVAIAGVSFGWAVRARRSSHGLPVDESRISFDAPQEDGVAPHSGHRSGIARRSGPQAGQSGTGAQRLLKIKSGPFTERSSHPSPATSFSFVSIGLPNVFGGIVTTL